MEKIKRWLGIFMVLIIVLSLSSGCGKQTETVKETELSVSVVTVEKRDIAQAVKYPGTVRGVNEVYIMPKVAARVTGIYVKPGDMVKVGQTLITLDRTDFEAAIKQGEAAVAMAEAGKKANDIQLENARLNYERTKKLFEAGAASQQQLETAQVSYEVLASGSAEAALEQARAGLLSAQTQLKYCTITSPINGVVGSINLSLGDTASPQSPAAAVTDTSLLEIETLVSESEVSYIKTGDEVDILIKAVSDKTLKGKVDSVSNVPDPVKRNYVVKVVLDNPDSKIKSGMFAEVIISTLNKQDVLCVPLSAVIPRSGRETIYTVDKDNRAREIDVKTGLRDNSYVEIMSGVKAGDKVITKGNTLVNEGTLVRVVAEGGK
ncbi:MAG: efflux RND transporter periplasmic adaptor subunit [Syntrophomonadaceae bacterium]